MEGYDIHPHALLKMGQLNISEAEVAEVMVAFGAGVDDGIVVGRTMLGRQLTLTVTSRGGYRMIVGVKRRWFT
jgi:hypothetical protein